MGSAAINIYSQDEIEKLAISGKLVYEFLNQVEALVHPGTKTIAFHEAGVNFAKANEAIAAFMEVPNYYHSVCVSVNEQIVHGIPGNRELREGDLVKVDYGLKKDGYIGDSCRSYLVGTAQPKVKKLVEVTQESLYLGIEQAVIGNRIGDIGSAIQKHVEKHGFSVVREYVGHGVGKELHEAPSVPHYGQKRTGIELKEGMVIAIEPMINMGTWRSKVLADRWTVVTMDNKWSAQFEHSIAITKDGPRILTK